MKIFQFSELRQQMLKAQLSVRSAAREVKHLTLCLNHLMTIKSQLDGREETSLAVKLHLLSDPARFLVSRLLDPHCLGYKWPFGGLVFSFTVLSQHSKDEEVRPDHIFLDAAVLVGAGWDSERLCLTEDISNRCLGRIRGVPTDKKQFCQPPHSVLIPLYSSQHSGQLLQVPVGRGDQPAEFWQRRNIYLRVE